MLKYTIFFLNFIIWFVKDGYWKNDKCIESVFILAKNIHHFAKSKQDVQETGRFYKIYFRLRFGLVNSINIYSRLQTCV